MIIGGIQKLSLIDYPGHSAAVIFTVGCNFRCGYCHDAELVLPERHPTAMPIEDVFNFLQKRQGKLDAVVVCGGEPTIHDDLPEFIHSIKQLGFLVKLDSNGTRPDMLSKIIANNDVDFIAMDIKGPLWKYSTIASRPVDGDAIKNSISLIIKSGVDHEFRTTVVKELLDVKDFDEIGKMVNGAERFALQKFMPAKTLNPQFTRKFAYSDAEMETIRKKMSKYVKMCVVR
ncbi:anaerobic ribonucleoside-triphosphate reductase activating protein [Candidatus Saccharibacteria bacterium]|nr:anaerobic ribonucleoside-triphosphate reductase activating protein [Candidatus Saccharibacteria bacterium]